jgi:hypothetical protein
MDSKQEKLKNLVIAYFQQRRDTTISPAGGGSYLVKLNSEVAQTEFRGRSELSLVFDSERAYQNPESELIIPSHPLLEVIRNSLENNPDEDVRLSEAYIPVQLLSPDGNVVVPHLTFSAEAHRVEYDVSYRPTIVLTYRVDYESDERSENIIRLCYDANSGTPRHDFVNLLHEFSYLEGSPPYTKSNGSRDLSAILDAGRAEVEARINSDIAIFGNNLVGLLEEEKSKLEKYFQREMENERNSVARQQISDGLGKKIEEIERKLACRINIKLLSVLRVWWAFVDYRITFKSHRGEFTTDAINYALQTERTEFVNCDRCGNRTTYNVCKAAKHVVCGGQCDVSLNDCKICKDSYCPKHGCDCSGCSGHICYYDRGFCSYGEHSDNDFFCVSCLLQSFEELPICQTCRAQCDLCERLFPRELLALCRIGGEQVCWDHNQQPDGLVCSECDEIACEEHTLMTADNYRVCLDHVRTSTCCRRTFGNSRLVTCSVNKGELLCPSHKLKCMGCGLAACEKHTSTLAEHSGVVCDNCSRSCSVCEPEKHYLEADLTRCVTGGEMVCSAHTIVCVVGKETVCRHHAQTSVIGEPLCEQHVGSCIQCDNAAAGKPVIHRNDTLQFCAICRNTVCVDHREVCPTCRTGHLCFTHHSELPACAGCGKLSCGSGNCGAATDVCANCNITYCRHCCVNRKNCRTCKNLPEVPLNDSLTKLLNRAARGATKDVELVRSVTEARPQQITIYAGFNQTYEIVLVDYKPPALKFWKSDLRLRIVATRAGKIKGISVKQVKKE